MPIDSYDPDVAPGAQDWLALGEDQRLALVLAHHAAGTGLTNARLHAAIHVVVETQLALGDPALVGETLLRLERGGMSRHDAIHAIGTAVSQLLLDVSNAPTTDRGAAMRRYAEALESIQR